MFRQVCIAWGNAMYTLTVDASTWTIGTGDEDTDVAGHSFMVHMGSSISPGDRVACGVIEQQ
jgi:Cu/Zn superoxide dismutase